jgi:hypothetical protein
MFQILKKTGLLALSAVLLSRPCRAQDMPLMAPAVTPPAASNPAPDPAEQEKWRKRIGELRGQRDVSYGLGAVGTVGGVVLVAAGYSKLNDAESVPGCERTDMFTITCTSQQATDQANEKLDKGRQSLLLGVLALTAGVVGICLGADRDTQAKRMEKRGKEKGFTLGLSIQEDKSVLLALNRRF